MNFNIINGNDDYIQKAEEFARLYNNPRIPVVKIREKMNLNHNTYRKLLKYCKENKMVKLRYKYNKWNKRYKDKRIVKNYTKIRRKGYNYFMVCKFINNKDCYFATFKEEKQAQRMVELLRECDWDYSKRYELKEKVLSEEGF